MHSTCTRLKAKARAAASRTSRHLRAGRCAQAKKSRATMWDAYWTFHGKCPQSKKGQLFKTVRKASKSAIDRCYR